MIKTSRLNLSALTDSPYATELQRGVHNLRFSPLLETEYVRENLLRNRLLIRMACIIALLLAMFRAVEHTFADAWHTLLLIDFVLVICGSLILASIAWSRTFELRFTPWAQVIVPLRNAIAAVHIAEAATRGQLEMLMVMMILLIGPFFFVGLRFRTALLAGVLTLASFIAAAIFFGLAPAIALRSCVFLLVGLVACAIAAYNFEKISRKSFLETRLLTELAQHDALTGAKNRRVFDEHLTRLWPQAIQDDRTIALLLIDVDHFKAYNDRYGHQAGDQTLRRVAQTLQHFVRRPLDVLARYGGEEFAAVLYDVDSDEAVDTANRLRRAVEELAIEHRGSRTSAKVTISIGVAVVEPMSERNPRGALQLADQALYQAKVRGRNRVEVMNDTEYKMLVTGVFSKDDVAAAVPTSGSGSLAP